MENEEDPTKEVGGKKSHTQFMEPRPDMSISVPERSESLNYSENLSKCLRSQCERKCCPSHFLSLFGACLDSMIPCGSIPQCQTGTCCPGHVCIDDDESFMASVVIHVRCMSKKDKLQLRTQFQEVLYNSLYKATKHHHHCVPSMFYIPSKPVQCMDEDEVFFFGLIPVLKRLSPQEKLQARINFMKHLNDKIEELADKVVQQEEVIENLVDASSEKEELHKRRVSLPPTSLESMTTADLEGEDGRSKTESNAVTSKTSTTDGGNLSKFDSASQYFNQQ